MDNVIVYLIRGTERSLRGFLRSLRLLEKNIIPWSSADVVVFHEDNLDVEALTKRLANEHLIERQDSPVAQVVLSCPEQHQKCALKFLKVDFSRVPKELESIDPSNRGYRHMCHFFANDIFNRPELQGYRWQMRLDDDSFVLSPLRFDVFAEMAAGGYKYGYRAVVKDKECVCRGLWQVAERYFKAAGCARDFATIMHLGMYYTNFEICDLRWFRSPDWQDFFRTIDDAKGIWTNRWGDAPIRYLGVLGLLPDGQIRQFTELHYFHQSEWRAGFARRLPWDMVKYYLWVVMCLVRQRLCRV